MQHTAKPSYITITVHRSSYTTTSTSEKPKRHVNSIGARDELDELVCGASTWSSPFPPAASFSTTAGHHNNQELDFVSDDVVEQLLGIDDDEPLLENDLPAGQPPAPSPPKRRGRKPGSRGSAGPSITHVEAERQRRDKLNRRFFELRAPVPTVSRMDRASLLADAAAYIAELRGRVEHLEAKEQAATTSAAAATTAVAPAHSFDAGQLETLEVRMTGKDTAALRLTSEARHAPARLMLALRSLDLPVQHACVCRAAGVTVQDAVVDVPAAAQWNERRLRAVLLHWLQQNA